MTHAFGSRTDFEMQMMGYRLTTAEITYHLPDTPRLLQTFLWQHLDMAPKYPRLTQFLEFWDAEIEGRIHSVRLGSTEIVKPSQMHHADHLLMLQ